MNLRNLVLGFGLGALGVLPCFSQNVVEGCDYLRKLENVERKDREFGKVNNLSYVTNYNDFKDAFQGEAKNYLDGLVMNIFFKTNESDLSENDVIDINKYYNHVLKGYIEDYGKITSFLIEGYADCVGDPESNYPLSEKRAESVARSLKRFFPHVPIYICAFGEGQSSETIDSLELEKYRTAKIIPKDNPFRRALDLCKGDVYLLDQSGSTKYFWNHFQNYIYPDSSEVYSFSKFIPPAGMNISYITPQKYPESFHTYDIKTEVAGGATAYYESIDTLIPLVSDSIVMTSIINSEENIGGCSPQKILEKCKSKNIVSNSIGINLNDEWKKQLVKISNETQGKFYFIREFN